MMAASLSSSFVFYQSFYDMIAWIPDMETQLAAYGMICAYALNGIEPQTAQVQAAPAVVVSQTIEPETAPREELQTMVQQTELQSTRWTAQPEGQAIEQQAAAAVPVAEQADLWEGEPILRYGENKYPITQRELSKVQSFAQELYQTYGGGRRPNEADMERVMEYTVARREIDGDRAVAVLDEGRADLLWYAFEKASAAKKLNWRYIDGMYRRFEQRDITTGAEAYQYDLLRGMTVS